jgi:sterol desaturase/sphingolipid hydroxylase (fatty acid hydroxylase superfamily)
MNMLFLGVAGVLLALLERVPQLRFRRAPLFRRYFSTDVIYLVTGYIMVASLSLWYFRAGSNFFGNAMGLPRLASLNLPLWLSVPLALAALDLGQYVAHYLMHRLDLLWEFHKIHHSSPVIDWLATFRSHFAEQVLRRVVGVLLLIVAGFPATAALLAGGIFTAWSEFNHSNLKLNLRFLEPVLITPRLHRLHHVPRTMEKNLGTVFTFWDRARGTFITSDPGDRAMFGNGEPGYPQTWTTQLLEPMLRIMRVHTAQTREDPGRRRQISTNSPSHP